LGKILNHMYKNYICFTYGSPKKEMKLIPLRKGGPTTNMIMNP
jgi:hypothetical protein